SQRRISSSPGTVISNRLVRPVAKGRARSINNRKEESSITAWTWKVIGAKASELSAKTFRISASTYHPLLTSGDNQYESYLFGPACNCFNAVHPVARLGSERWLR